MFQKIVNPTTNRKVDVHSKLGRKIVNNYAKSIGFQIGGTKVNKEKIGDLDVEFVYLDGSSKTWDQKYVDLINNSEIIKKPVMIHTYFILSDGEKYNLLPSSIRNING